ncbi:hypothetical protein TcYC6_0016450 [Trypanosoma cruzi]|uniref:Uncharacterized protein n=1 Tax=Trypanosoma cruzi TaxID=5693 RepID=A0A7J6Y4E2_TRYCR|nr:hypothetical protein ECC02_005587 [Trypanosoma cruzi]KAF8277175.1 hypothetical protein TcYC6_0016450 [Trypanosoma cruzi]
MQCRGGNSTGSGGLKGSFLPLGAYRRVPREATSLWKTTMNTAKEQVAVVWETVSSWEGSEVTSSDSCASGINDPSLEDVGFWEEHLQIRMELIRRLNPFRQGPPVGGAAHRTASAERNGMTGTKLGSIRTQRACGSVTCGGCVGEDILFPNHENLCTTPKMPQTYQKVRRHPCECTCRVRRLAPAEWSELLQLGSEDVVEL